jgi:hypothetical protein
MAGQLLGLRREAQDVRAGRDRERGWGVASPTPGLMH